MLNEKCYVEDLLTYLGKKWTLPILRYLFGHNKLRFNELMKHIGEITPRSLSQRLKELIGLGIINKQQFNEIPPRVEYSLTESGRDLTNFFKGLEEWGKKWGEKTFLKTQFYRDEMLLSIKRE
ncbi:hypothetical protein LCGC14_1117830 [marine sediment metagenome]|uniref:HTH hxlR-type domain-containing protein n=1 Tax=marine sediment metagenome TaxID=412755 RepID=A0A0F9M9N3_9ZZZZ